MERTKMSQINAFQEYVVAPEEPSADETDLIWEEEPSELLADEADNDAEPIEDSVQTYLREIGQVSLLTAADEVTLAQNIINGLAARQALQQLGDLPLCEQVALERTIAQGDEARRTLIQSNLRLVVSIAKKYHGGPLSFMDLVQEGNIGLMRAVEKFDYTRGNRFSTYATWWIRQAVTRAIAEQGRLIRLPVHLSDAIGKLRRVTHQLEQPLGDEGEGHLSDHLADDESTAPVEIAAQRMLQQDLSRALMELPERERAILQLRYGLTDGRRRTLEEVGVTFGITRERTRQIEAEALRHLRSPNLGGRLQAYLE